MPARTPEHLQSTKALDIANRFENELVQKYAQTKAGSQAARIALNRLLRFRDGDVEDKPELPRRRKIGAQSRREPFSKLSPEDICLIRQGIEAGKKPGEIAKEVDLPQATVFMWAKKFNYSPHLKVTDDELVELIKSGLTNLEIRNELGWSMSSLTNRKSLLKAEGRI